MLGVVEAVLVVVVVAEGLDKDKESNVIFGPGK